MAKSMAKSAVRSIPAGTVADDGRKLGVKKQGKQGRTEELARADRAGSFSRDHSAERNSKIEARRLNSVSTHDVNDFDGDNKVVDNAEVGNAALGSVSTASGVPSSAIGTPGSATATESDALSSARAQIPLNKLNDGKPQMNHEAGENGDALLSTTAEGDLQSNAWASPPRIQSSVPKTVAPKSFQRVQLSFVNKQVPTENEIQNFDLTRAFIGLHVSNDNQLNSIITTGSFTDLATSEMFDRVTPEVWKAPLTLVHMTYITFDKSISEQHAKEIMLIIDNDIKLPANSPPFFLGLDIGGNIGIKSRRGIESVIYSAKTPHQNDIGDAIKKIVKSNAKLSLLFGCNAQQMVRKQLQLDNCLGTSKQDVKSAVFGLTGYEVSNLQHRPIRHTTHTLQPDEIFTSNEMFLTLLCPKTASIPRTYLVPTISGVDKEIVVTKVFEYSNHRTVPSPDTIVTSSDPRFKTRLCSMPLNTCSYGKKCLFAHDVSELRRRLPRDTASDKCSTAHLPSYIGTTYFPRTEVPVTGTETETIPSLANGTIGTEQHALAVTFTRTVELPPGLSNVSLLTTTSTILDSQSFLASGTDEETFIMSHKGRSPPCGPARPSLNLHVASAAANSVVPSSTAASPGPTDREPVTDFSESAPTTPFQAKVLGDGETRIPVSRKSANPSTSGSGKSPVSIPSQPLKEAPVKKSPSVLMYKPSDSRFRTSMTSPPNSQSRLVTSPISRASPPGSIPSKKAQASPHHNRVSDPN